MQLITKLGSIGSRGAGINATGGANSITIDFAPGPQPGRIWLVEHASLTATFTAGFLSDFVLSGLWIVPNNAQPVNDPANTGNTQADFQNRGIKLPVTASTSNGSGIAYWAAALTTRAYIPSGFILRAVLATYGGAPPTIGQFIAQAMVRELDLDSCEPIPVCVGA